MRRMLARLARLVQGLVLGLALWPSLSVAHALTLGEAAVTVPDGWQPVGTATEHLADYTGPDGTLLTVRWWFPDEPLTGAEGVSFVARSFPAGPALVIRSGAGGLQRVTVAFDQRSATGEILLLSLEGTASAEALEALLQPVAQSVRFGARETAIAAPLAEPAPQKTPADGHADDILALLSDLFGGDCAAVPVKGDALAAALAPAQVQARGTCTGQTVELALLALPEDPRRASGPLQMLYLRAFMAGGGRVVALADPQQGALVLLRPDGAAGFAAEVTDLPKPAAPLFAGEPSAAWELHLARSGQSEWTRYENGAFIADVPAGPDYRTTGLRTVDPLVRLPGASDGFSTRITLDIQTARLQNVVIALVQTGQQGRLDWDDHEIWLGIEHRPDTPAELVLAVQGQVKERVPVPGADVLAGLVLTMRPDGLIRVSNGTGAVLAEARMAPVPTPGPYHLQISATAPLGDVAAFLALREVRLEEVPTDLAALDPAALPADAPQEVVLFDGQGPGVLMALHGPRGMDPAVARFDNGLIVRAEAAALQGIGLYSVDPVVWLDRFGPGASARLRLEFDPSATSGVEVALAAPMSNADNEPGLPGLRLHWRRLGEGFFLTRSPDRDPPRYAAVPAMPAVVDVVLHPEGVQMLAEGFPDDILPWSMARDGAGLRLFVLAKGDHESLPAEMALRRITLLRTPGAAEPAPAPAPEVAPLPETSHFPADGWEGYGLAGVDFTAVGSFAADGSVAVDVPEGNEAGRAGVLSPVPVAVLDHRLERTGHRLTYAFDPDGTDGFEIILSQSRLPEMEDGSEVILQLVRQSEGRMAGDWLLHVWGGYYKTWTRRIPGKVMQDWDGRFEVALTRGTVQVTLPGITRLVAPDFIGIRPGVSLFTTVHSRSPLRYGPAKMALRAITGGWITPAGMTERARLVLLGPEGFDPEAWLGLLRDELEEQVR